MPTLAIHGGDPLIPTTSQRSRALDRDPLIESFTRYIGCRYGITTCNGSASLISALIGAGVTAGDEVITVSFTWYTTVTSILAVNAIPVFVDIDPDTFTMDPDQIEQRITPRTRAILAVSLYGQPADYPRINQIAKRHGLTVIDDACQSFGASIDGRKLGAATDITAFSFSGKPIVSTGGGLVACDDETFYERMLLAGQHPSMISTHARNPENHELASTGGFGYNLRIDEKAAELACERLEQVDAVNEHRRANAHYLTESLRQVPGLTPPAERPGTYHIYHQYTGLVDEAKLGISRDELVEALNAEGVPVIAYVSMKNFVQPLSGDPRNLGPIHRRPLFRKLAQSGRFGHYVFPEGNRPDYESLDLPVTESVIKREFNLIQKWLNPPFDTTTMEQYVQAIHKVLDHRDEIIAWRNSGKPHHPRPIFLTPDKSDTHEIGHVPSVARADTDLVRLQDVPGLRQDQVVAWHRAHLNRSLLTLMQLGGYDSIRVARAEGPYLTTTDGRRLLDMVSAYGALSHGHNHPRVVRAARWFDERREADLLQEFPSPWAATLAHNLAALTPGDLDVVFLCNSGAESIEGALKLVQRYFGGRRDRFAYAENSLHGKTHGALSITGREKYRAGVRHFEDWPMVPFGDAEALAEMFAADRERRIAGLVLEPIQGEAGVIVPPRGYLRTAADLCREHGALLILDEIQTAFGRTGTLFRCEAEGVVPDVLCVAKSLGGGVASVAATITRPSIHRKAYGRINDCLVHTSTFGGRARTAAVAIEALAVVVDEGFAERAARLGARLKEDLEGVRRRHPDIVAAIRGEGLMLGLELRPPRLSGLSTPLGAAGLDRILQNYLPGIIGAELLQRHNILASFVLNNPRVLRLYPALVATEHDLAAVPIALDAVFERGLARLVTHHLTAAIRRAGLDTVRGWLRDW